MKILKYSFFGLMILTTVACEWDLRNCLKQEGAAIEELVILDKDITKIELEVPVKLIISEGETQEIIIEGPANIVDKIIEDSKHSGDKWKVDVDGCADTDGVTIFARLTGLEEIKIDGSGFVETDGIFTKSSELLLDIDGSGKIEMELDILEKVDIDIDGSGNVKLTGVSDETDIDIDGSGKVKFIDLKSKDCEIDIDGSGNVETWVTGELKIDINGAGFVCHKGDPNIEFDISGSGKIEECD